MRSVPKPDPHDLAALKAAFGQNLRQARLARRMTQAEVAEISGITQTDISEIERGCVDRNPSIETLYRLAVAVRSSVRMLLMQRRSCPPDEDKR
jgi:transcriptional regulator with XRE-family HTH domain